MDRPDGGEGSRVPRMGVHDPVDVGPMAVDVQVARGVRRRLVGPVHDPSVEVQDDHRLGGEILVPDAGRLDGDERRSPGRAR